MKIAFSTSLVVAFALMGLLSLMGCAADEVKEPEQTNEPPREIVQDEETSPNMTSITITIDDSDFAAHLYDNEAAEAFLQLLPLTLEMQDLHNNEKYFYLPEDLPSDSAESPSVIEAGELMCWSSNCLVLFYDTFSNSYGGYVKLGYIDDPTSLAESLGSGTVTISFKR